LSLNSAEFRNLHRCKLPRAPICLHNPDIELELGTCASWNSDLLSIYDVCKIVCIIFMKIHLLLYKLLAYPSYLPCCPWTSSFAMITCDLVWAEKNLGEGTPPLDRTWSVTPDVPLLLIGVIRESILECITFILPKFVLENSTIIVTGSFGMTVLYSWMAFLTICLFYHNIIFCLVV